MSTPSDPFSTTAQSAPPAWQPAPAWGTSPGQPQAYGAPPAAYPGPPVTSAQAVIALGCAMASYVLAPFVGAVVALVLIPGARDEIAASGGRLTGEGMLTAARVLAWLNIALCVLGALAVVAAFVLLVDVGLS